MISFHLNDSALSTSLTCLPDRLYNLSHPLFQSLLHINICIYPFWHLTFNQRFLFDIAKQVERGWDILVWEEDRRLVGLSVTFIELLEA